MLALSSAVLSLLLRLLKYPDYFDGPLVAFKIKRLCSMYIRLFSTKANKIMYRVFFFYCSALKMTKRQPLKEISEPFLPKTTKKEKS